MIISIKHKALKNYWTKGQSRGLNSKWLPKIDIVLDALDSSSKADDMNLPGLYFHRLTGQEIGRFSVRVTGNWRITFQFNGEDAELLDLEDYH